MPDDLARRDRSDAIHAAAALADPVRGRLYELVAAASAPIGRDEAAEHAGVSRSLAGYHLDQLVADGLLRATFARRSGRTGPGAGRPAKLYERAPVEVVVQLPPRDDALVAHLLASAIESEPSGQARSALRSVAHDAGAAMGAALADGGVETLLRALEARGYEPVLDDGGIRLRNCPFHHLVADHVDLVCSLNEELLGAIVGQGSSGLVAALDPGPDRCCVVLRPAPA
jgi:predicted ArsR family transcriptional regulator